MMPKRRSNGKRRPLYLCFLQACDPGLSRTCDQNIYLSGLCYLFQQDLSGSVLQGRPGYQGEGLGMQCVKLSAGGSPYLGTSTGRATIRDTLPSPFVSGLCRMSEGQRRPGISV